MKYIFVFLIYILVNANANAVERFVNVPQSAIVSDSVPIMVYSEDSATLVMMVFNRWGEKLIEFERANAFNDTLVFGLDFTEFPENSVYYWVITIGNIDIANPEQFRGPITIISDPADSSNVEIGTKSGANIRIYSYNQSIIIRGGEGIVAIYNIAGKLIHQEKISAGEHTIDLNRNGIYIVRVTGKAHWRQVSHTVMLSALP
ncbi:MAG: T9SS type A sorting domain-containing protein [Flavobacteriales bacterium]|nr:T9SS type A sorting domain-containing protein [Flavobacteriales bacterium]